MSIILLIFLPWTAYASNLHVPVSKCKDPLPRYPGLNISSLEGDLFKYVYTPNLFVYKAVDSITMMINKLEHQDNVYLETLRARTIFGTQTKMQFNVKYLEDGIIKRITKAGEMSYIASIVDIKGDVGLLYVCSNEGEENGRDFRYVIARKWVNAKKLKHPDIMFKETNKKYNFKGNFRKLPQRWMKKLLKD